MDEAPFIEREGMTPEQRHLGWAASPPHEHTGAAEPHEENDRRTEENCSNRVLVEAAVGPAVDESVRITPIGLNRRESRDPQTSKAEGARGQYRTQPVAFRANGDHDQPE